MAEMKPYLVGQPTALDRQKQREAHRIPALQMISIALEVTRRCCADLRDLYSNVSISLAFQYESGTLIGHSEKR